MDLHYSQTAIELQPVFSSFYYLMDLHYSQTKGGDLRRRRWVLLPYGFTLFSNSSLTWQYFFHVLLPYGFTLFSNHTMNLETVLQFYYLMDLHYSQTCRHDGRPPSPFYYLMDLHYSQTDFGEQTISAGFYYLMDLHYSQTQKGSSF